MKNLKYFFSEALKLFGQNFISTALGFISLLMVFFLLFASVIAILGLGAWTALVASEAEVSVYYNKALNPYALEVLVDAIKATDGTKGVTLVSEEEAYVRMSGILGKEAEVLKLFDENPFDPFIEIQIDLEKRNEIVAYIQNLNHVEHIKDNKALLDQLASWRQMLRTIGVFIGLSVVLSTFLITSHIIREGVYRNKTYINTLQLLGAPSAFIYTPYFFQGIFLSFVSGACAVLAFMFLFNSILPVAYEFVFYHTPFTPMSIGCFFVLFACITGLFSSVWGIKTIKIL